MSLIHPWMGWLALLAVIPLILHWLMKPQPKKLLFPALRLIQLRRRQNSRRLRLRHLLLLLLRVGIIAGIVFTLARPRVPSVNYLPTFGEWSILIGIVIVSILLASLLHHFRPLKHSAPIQQAQQTRRRIVTIASIAALLIAALVVWPLQARIRSDVRGTAPPIDAHIPVSAAVVFDTSLSMNYQQQGKTRLEVARDIATNHLGSLPRNSRLALTDTQDTGPIRFAPDVSTAITRISRLETQAISQPLDERLFAAIEAHQNEISLLNAKQNPTAGDVVPDEFIREIYLLTDFSRGGWAEQRIENLVEKLQAAPQVGLYLIDVSSDPITNFSLNQLRLSDSMIPAGGEVRLSVSVNSTALSPEERTIELHLQPAEGTGELLKLQQVTVKTSASTPATAEFLLRNLQGTLRQGEIRLASTDPLTFDDLQSLTIEVLPPLKMLVVSDRPSDAQYWINALAPSELVKQGRSSIQCVWSSPSRMRQQKLTDFGAVTLINVEKIPAEDWDSLEAFVQRGGGLAVMLGKPVDAISYNTPPSARRLLPGELFGFAQFNPPEFLDLEPGLHHPLLKKFAERQITTLGNVEVKRFWRVEPYDESSNALIRFSDNKQTPALLERNVGKGRVLMFTTGVSRQGWNELPVIGWEWVVFADQMARYLAQRSFVELNSIAGEPVLVPLPDNPGERSFLLRKPNRQQVPTVVPQNQSALLLRDLDQLGPYRLVSSARESRFEKGFSINYARAESDLTRIDTEELNRRLGKDRFQIVRSLADLDRTVRTGRIGVEALPEFFIFLILFFAGEIFLSNHFYRENQHPSEGSVQPLTNASTK